MYSGPTAELESAGPMSALKQDKVILKLKLQKPEY